MKDVEGFLYTVERKMSRLFEELEDILEAIERLLDRLSSVLNQFVFEVDHECKKQR